MDEVLFSVFSFKKLTAGAVASKPGWNHCLRRFEHERARKGLAPGGLSTLNYLSDLHDVCDSPFLSSNVKVKLTFFTAFRHEEASNALNA